MPGFWELPAAADLPQARRQQLLGTVRHTITHHRYTLRVSTATASGAHLKKHPFGWFSEEEMPDIPLSATVIKSLKLNARYKRKQVVGTL
jgi:adenine-specific DNA glycosylase